MRNWLTALVCVSGCVLAGCPGGAPPPTIALAADATTLNTGASEVVTAGVTGTFDSVAWSSAPEGIISLDTSSPPNATITGLAPGTVTITATLLPQGIADSLTIEVQDKSAPRVTLMGPAQLTVACGSGAYQDPGATAQDDVGGTLTLAYGGDTVNTSVPAVYTVSITATDQAGNVSAPVMRTVDVVDNTPPVLTLLAGNVTLSCGQPFIDPGATATDACDPQPQVQVTGGPLDTAAPGVVTFAYTATDSAGNMAPAQTRTVTVLDADPPRIVLNGGDMVVDCKGSFQDPGATVTDNCQAGIVPLVGGDIVDTARAGEYTITYDAADASGNRAIRQTRNVSVRDSVPPELVLNGADMVVECHTVYADPGAIATDDCSASVTPVIGGDVVDPNTPRDYVVTYDATDAAGNKALQRRRTVSVRDTHAPALTVIGSSTITLECPQTFNDPGAIAKDACDNQAVVIVGGNIVDKTKPGAYTITYRARDASQNVSAVAERTVTVEDTTAPRLVLLGSAALTLDCGTSFSDPGAQLVEACDLTATIQTAGDIKTDVPGTYTRAYSVRDASGNDAITQTRTVTVVDATPPELTLLGNATIDVECGSTYLDAGAQAADACEGVVPVQKTGSSIDTLKLGTYAVTYDAVDAAGNAAGQLTRTVIVADNTPPVITVVGAHLQEFSCGSLFSDQGYFATDACAPHMTPVIAGGDTVDTAVPGVYTLTYQATDDAGLESRAERKVSVAADCNGDLNWTQASSAAPWAGRSGFQSVVFNDRVWVIGGRKSASEVLNDVWSSADGTTWTEETANAPWQGRFGHQCLVFGGGIWLMGGAGKSSLFIPAPLMDDVWFSSDGMNWQLKTGTPGWEARSDFGGVVSGNRMWIMGGEKNNVLNVLNDVWSSADGIAWTRAIAAAPWAGRADPVVLDFQNRIWFMGATPAGTEDAWSSSDGVNWKLEDTETPFTRQGSSGAIIGGAMWIVGGLEVTDAPDRLRNDLWYTNNGHDWIQRDITSPWAPRSGQRTVVKDQWIWVIGGSSLDDVWYSEEIDTTGY